jgi:NACHT conflict system protein
MGKTLSYADAARLLGGPDSRIVTALDAVTGGIMLALVPALPAVLGLFDAKAEFIRLSLDLVRGGDDRVSRAARTQRIEAAHAVLVVTAYFEALAAADLPFRFADLALTRTEQETLARTDRLGALTLHTGLPLPRPYESAEHFRERLFVYYAALSAGVVSFIDGLAVGDRLSGAGRRRTDEVLLDLPAQAVDRYDELTLRLAAEFGEVALWSARRDHAATRAEVRTLGSAMSELHRMLSGISTGRVPDERRTALAAAYRAALDRPIVESADAPPGVEIPTLAQAYVQPLFRTAVLEPGVRPSDERWWATQPIRPDLVEFLTAHLTSTQATVAPLLVLGQPGSGKSVLTKVLAARLPAADFLPVRVILREVPADAELQDQIEHAVRAATGERLEWPPLVRSAPDALPVVMLDGFDELLQATGVSQTDYLVKIAAFQRREAEQGRPVAVLVTSRTSVADRARAPEDTVAMRLEAFDDDRVTAWLATWNAINAGKGRTPLPPAAVLRHRDLAGQPLLLLMLALYDADDNALQRLAGELGRGELYLRLLRRFAEREVAKHRPGLSDRDRDQAVDKELDQLSVVGLAMFNRGTQWITETELDADLAALFGPPAAADRHGLRAPLGAAEITLGRFFFIHRSRASRDDGELRAYEFLHATFGEFLVARAVWLALQEAAALEAASAFALGTAVVPDARLHTLLSFAPLSTRVSILGFLAELADALPAAEQARLAELVLRLFRQVHEPRPAPDYRPRQLSVPARHAAYSANLVLLAVRLAGQVTGADLFGADADRVAAWHSEALLWRSQLSSEDWSGVADVLALERLWDGDRRDIRLELATGDIQPPPIDPAWTYDLPSPESRVDVYAQHSPVVLTRKGYLQTGNLDDVALHALTPIFADLGSAVNTYSGSPTGEYVSAAHALLDAWLLPLRPATEEERRRLYLRCIGMAMWLVVDEQARYARVLLDRIATDTEVTPAVTYEVVQFVADTLKLTASWEVGVAVRRCADNFRSRVPWNREARDRQVVDELMKLGGSFAPSPTGV